MTFHTLDDADQRGDHRERLHGVHGRGTTWRIPSAISGERWRASNLGGVINGTGLRERAERMANGDVFWAYGDGRYATGSRPVGSPSSERSSISGSSRTRS